jgi:hypothetical protein
LSSQLNRRTLLQKGDEALTRRGTWAHKNHRTRSRNSGAGSPLVRSRAVHSQVRDDGVDLAETRAQPSHGGSRSRSCTRILLFCEGDLQGAPGSDFSGVGRPLLAVACNGWTRLRCRCGWCAYSVLILPYCTVSYYSAAALMGFLGPALASASVWACFKFHAICNIMQDAMASRRTRSDAAHEYSQCTLDLARVRAGRRAAYRVVETNDVQL